MFLLNCNIINTYRNDTLPRIYFCDKIKGIKEYKREFPFFNYLWQYLYIVLITLKKIEREEGLNNTPAIERKKREKKKTQISRSINTYIQKLILLGIKSSIFNLLGYRKLLDSIITFLCNFVNNYTICIILKKYTIIMYNNIKGLYNAKRQN